ncbi:MAG: hypothetical protein R3E96_15660 [Planctomycetota bacterium]
MIAHAGARKPRGEAVVIVDAVVRAAGQKRTAVEREPVVHPLQQAVPDGAFLWAEVGHEQPTALFEVLH